MNAMDVPETYCSCGKKFIVVMVDCGDYAIFICNYCDSPFFATKTSNHE